MGGLLFSQMLTLFVTPVVYTHLEQFRQWTGRGRHRRLEEARPEEGRRETVEV